MSAEVEIIERRVDRTVEALTDWARHMAARFNGAVYLLGSVLHHPSPRDIDIRIIIADHEFAARYGMPMAEIPAEKQVEHRGVTRTQAVPFDEGVSQRWVDDIAKLGAAVSHRLTYNADVKVWPDSYWRADVYPSPVPLAAPTPPWWHYTKYCPNPIESSIAASGEPPR